MPDPIVYVAFTVHDVERFEAQLQAACEHDDNVVGLRTGQSMEHRPALKQFADQMEEKLKKNDSKTHWRELPVEALFRLLNIELEEYRVAHEFLTVKEARTELVDVANYALILWDRLSLEVQNENINKK